MLLDRLEVRDAELNEVENLVIEEPAEHEVVGPLLLVRSESHEAAVVLVREELDGALILEGSRVVASVKFDSVGLLQCVLLEIKGNTKLNLGRKAINLITSLN